MLTSCMRIQAAHPGGAGNGAALGVARRLRDRGRREFGKRAAPCGIAHAYARNYNKPRRSVSAHDQGVEGDIPALANTPRAAPPGRTRSGKSDLSLNRHPRLGLAAHAHFGLVPWGEAPAPAPQLQPHRTPFPGAASHAAVMPVISKHARPPPREHRARLVAAEGDVPSNSGRANVV